jgi:tetratricopeptide (TPR) repeat protein
VNYRRLMALLALGRLADAEKLFGEVTQAIEKGEVGEWRASAGFWLAKSYLDAGEKEADAARKRQLLSKGATLMFDYSRATQHASYNNLLSAAQTWIALEEWARAEEVYAKLIDVFGREAQYKEDIDQRVKRAYADALMQQRKFTEAEPLYQELEVRFVKDPTVLRAAALCFGGWLEVVDKKVVEVPGSGNYKHAIELWDKLEDQGFKREDKMVVPGWFEAKLQAIYCRYRAKDADPTYLTQAQLIMKNFDNTVAPFLDPGDLLERIGGEDGKRKWDYVREKLR